MYKNSPPYHGLTATSIWGCFTIAAIPNEAIPTNHSTIIGPNNARLFCSTGLEQKQADKDAQ